MTEVTPALYVGTTQEIGMQPFCVNLSSRWHREKHPGLDMNHHCYIIHEDPYCLSVNWVDSPDPKYFDYNGQGIDTCERILDFLERHQDQSRLIACDKGISRSPSIAMLYFAKRGDWLAIPHEFDQLSSFFQKNYYPSYDPGGGISQFLRENWDKIK